MKRILKWLVTPSILVLMGLCALALLIWMEGPLLAFDGVVPLASAVSRWLLIGLVLLCAAMWAGWRLWQARRREGKLAAGVAASGSVPAPGVSASAEEVVVLGERMRSAMAVLRQSNPGWKMRGQYLYTLPWYMFVGAPGAGKTTALTHSGLNFPLADKLGSGAIGGIGGTRNCDWWFTDEAVLLDTAGRYTTQDSYTEVDKLAWTGFLGLLKKYRRRRPVNGVIVAISIADLLQQGEAGRQAQALAIRARIHELHEQLGLAFPVYVTVTKADLLAGFAEFFDTFGREERAQVWGMTFPLPADGTPAAALASFPAEFEALERQLQSRVLDRMQQERDLQRRAVLYSFPQQFAGIGDVLHRFLTTVFAANRYEQPAMLRGVYFTSGTQEGSPIDRVMASLAASFGLSRKVLPAGTGAGRSYFITRLMRDVIFQEAGLAGMNPRGERRRVLAEWAALAGAGLLALVLAAALTVSYGRNEQLVARAAAAATELGRLAAAMPTGGNALVALPVLNAARALPAGYAERNDRAPLLSRMGLYQGEKLGDGAVTAYRRLLRGTLLPRIVVNMENALRRGDANDQEFLYETLRVYLMLGERKHFDAASVQAWVEFDWRGSLPEAGAAQRQQLLAHAGALLEDEDAEPVQLDAALVAQARLTLAGMPLSERIYNRLKRMVAATRLPEFSVNGTLGRDVSTVLGRTSGAPLSRGVSGIYTLAGYRKLAASSGQAVAELGNDKWVLGRDETVPGAAGIAELRSAVMQRYFADYILQWDGFLGDLRVVPLSSLDQAARVAGALAGPESPLRALLQAAARETTLEGDAAAAAAPGGVDQLVRGKLSAARKQLESVLGPANVAAPVAPLQNPVDQHFAQLHKSVAGAAPTPLDQTLGLLKDAALYFDAAESARRSNGPAPAADALVRLKRGGDGQPPPVSTLLQNIDSGGNALALGSERARLNALWSGSGAPFCRDAIAGRYPLVRGSARDATADDFGKFFGPGGIMDDFFTKNLAASVDMSGARWRWRGGAGPAGVSQEALDQFQHGARVRDMLFAGGARQPSMRFDLKASNVDPAFGELTLDIDGQPVLAHAGETPRSVPIVLPSGKGNGSVRFDGTPPLRTDLHTEGPWAWLRMIDRGAVDNVQGERFQLAFTVDGHKAVYELTAGSVNNPFRREALEQFRCPASL